MSNLEIFGIIAVILIILMIVNDYIRFKLYMAFCEFNDVEEHYLLRAYIGSYSFRYNMKELYDEYVIEENQRVLKLTEPDIHGDENFFEPDLLIDTPVRQQCFPDPYYIDEVFVNVNENTYFTEDVALAALLYNDVLCMNRNWWKKEWPEDAQQTFAFAVSAGDTFAYACADAEELLYSELQDLWEHFVLHETFGPMVWVCKKRKMKPLAIWCKQINATGIWNIDEMGLEDNPSEQ